MNAGAWRKIGVVFQAPGSAEWLTSHAALPIVQALGGSRVRVFFSSRDTRSRAQIGSFEIDLEDPTRYEALTPSPVVALGPLGSHDDSGVTGSCLVEHQGRLLLYYTGWSLGVTVPFYFNIGLAVSEDGGRTFRKHSLAPVMGRSPVDPFLVASPYVLVEGGTFRMWYVSARGWTVHEGRPRHHYHLRYAESADGVEWRPTGRVCIDFASEAEYAIARPCILKEGGTYRMWFSARGRAYRLGYAESADGLTWTRLDDRAGISPSPEGWDSDMNEYPAVLDIGNKRWMFYNGNDYGRTGIGLAVCER